MSIQDYSGYTVSDFLEDDFFVRWAIYPDLETSAFWNSFLSKYPNKKDAFNQAHRIINLYRKQDYFGNEPQQNAMWEKIGTTIESQSRPAYRIQPVYYRIAATIAFIISFSAGVWLLLPSATGTTTIATAYGEVKTIVLPDNSTVTLNGNSSIKYKALWQNESSREVWLEGEAYFDVKHLNRNTTHISEADRFIVHSDNLFLEVLGTTFNVEHRRDETDVTLITGKISLQLSDTQTKKQESTIMAPGDHIEYVKANLILKKKLAKPSLVTAWMKGGFVFIDPYLKDIVESLQDDHGYRVEVKDKKLLALQIEGEINVATLKELLSTIEASLGLQIKETNKHIIISQ